ncbi:MotA/TolQ/ExbB proton channel family protein [Endozoicomonas sp. GU-1]|uniref:MotA/TolQ/ExbB proton channel family protein n=1 Tax=Endozoicomonas sp. GU-1 TaxID=3009078 RepID=UPI0022B2AE50|nr:MotA/TolQ/ExbB proton channel family protein [Endozoicomonas sp. GU-1]WBA80690.1 MotA/TolQ/ExbB proton channel family protein [Endozoicomonas sp. GU-1]WBA88256.1 MotA/TolQ/ExbB proton channel family protein [Endozoicomonas sp. GU-1]
MKYITAITKAVVKPLVVSLGLGLTFSAGASEGAAALQDLLNKIKADSVTESRDNKAREARFLSDKNSQQRLLAEAKAELKAQETLSDQLLKQSDDNEKVLKETQNTLDIRSGELKELFGVVRQFAGDNKGIFEASMITAQYPERTAFMAEMAESKKLPTTAKLEQFWHEVLREMVESGRVVNMPATVVYGEGDEAQKDIIRVGSFNAIADGKYLTYSPAVGKFQELSRQPQSGILSAVSELEASATGYTPFYLDPSRGQILSLLVQSPSIGERIDQGGVVGYVILGLGAFGLLLAAACFINLTRIGQGVRKQQKTDQVIKGNPLGDIMQAYQDNRDADLETLELKLDEIIMRAAPSIERGVGGIKLIASVAPLLGLLGTVVGMIATFQAITLFGTGDPKLMANGISEALVTTMLGLVVAIPTLFTHSLVNSKSRRLIQVLEEQSAGFIARHQEQDLNTGARNARTTVSVNAAEPA